MKNIGTIMFHVSAVGSGDQTLFHIYVYDKKLRKLCGNYPDEIKASTEYEAVQLVVSRLRSHGLTGRLRKVGPGICGYCGTNCTQSPRFVAETACEGLKAAWRDDERAEAQADSRAAAWFEDAAYGRD